MLNKDDKRLIRIVISLNSVEYNIVLTSADRTNIRTVSEYCRCKVLDKPVTIKTRNESLDEFMAEMMRLRIELGRAGKNFQLIVSKLQSLNDIRELEGWREDSENEGQLLQQKISEIKEKINSISDIWLQ
jgi:KaiC/GvpD/RAD55 family RecA-like ATPase